MVFNSGASNLSFGDFNDATDVFVRDLDGVQATPPAGPQVLVGNTESTKEMRAPVPVLGDTASDSSEHFLVNLSGADGANIVDGTGVGSILDDDPATITGRRLFIGSVAACEKDAGARRAVFTVPLPSPTPPRSPWTTPPPTPLPRSG